MKGLPEIIEALNRALTVELTAINQYFLHGEICGNWGYDRLYAFIRKESIDEMKHAEMIAERIDELGGTPNINVGPISSGGDLEKMLRDNVAAEEEAVERYTKQIQDVGMSDPTTRRLLEDILAEEERHLNEWRTLLGE